MPHFTLWFETEALRDRLLLVILLRIPPWFKFSACTGTPDVTIGTGEVDQGFPFPVRPGTVYIFDDEIPARAVGLAAPMRASIRVRAIDSDNVLVMRVWHELLHAVGQPADDMIPLAPEWQTSWERLLWIVWRWFGDPVDVPFWHERFYAWLTRRAMEAEDHGKGVS